LKELTVCCSFNVTDAGISMVIIHCNQLGVLSLISLPYITGKCTFCEDLRCVLYFYGVWYSYSRFITDHNGPLLHHIASRYISAHIFITFSLILRSVTCCIQTHRIIIHIFKDLCSDLQCFPLSYSIRFFGLLALTFPCRIQNYLLWFSFIIFSTFWPFFHVCSLKFSCKFLSSFSAISSFLFWSHYFKISRGLRWYFTFPAVIFCNYLHCWSIWKKISCYCPFGML